MPAIFSHRRKIPSIGKRKLFTAGKFVSEKNVMTEEIVKAIEKYNGANKFITSPTRGTVLNVVITWGNVVIATAGPISSHVNFPFFNLYRPVRNTAFVVIITIII